MTGRKLVFGSVFAVLPLVVTAPTPPPDLTVLGSILAGSPGPSWVEDPPAPDTLEGTFDATVYVNTEWSNQSDRDSIRGDLVANGFIGGYGRTFERSTPAGYITEDVKAFPDAAHAEQSYQWDLNYFHDPSDTVNNVFTPAIPESFGQKFALDAWRGIDIYFTKANYVFTVTVGGQPDYLPDVAIAQATSVYNFAPSRDVLQPPAKTSTQAPSMVPAVVMVGGAAAFVVLAVLAVAALLIAYATRRRQMPAPYAALSPDGKYWWDGNSWQPVVPQ